MAAKMFESSQMIEKINNKNIFYLIIHKNLKISLPNKNNTSVLDENE